ncbi:NAD(+) diphosphatase [Pseudarthrobacter sp. PS3-L1]|uniref:NAD(+) diphosphatase n=1 Tax=Pseudarthrobacter sp. PS3-L1 TaxID=3046207 RepID=UPI0024BA5D3E|nr:NAD(+) diphosphatase [Pseudarthrobacter sp. PS3-L1]MDJ0321451.1 NAD(+) diphosphatase [Pseudarthrobacter sp. PS3-L1]
MSSPEPVASPQASQEVPLRPHTAALPANHLFETVLPVVQARIDRGSLKRSRAGMVEELLATPGTQAMVIAGRQALVGESSLILLSANDAITLLARGGHRARHAIYLGSAEPGSDLATGTETVLLVLDDALDPADVGAPSGSRWLGFREIAATLNATETALFIEASAIANWHALHTHCPRCGTPTVVESGGWVRRCPADGSEHYPRTDPAIIVTVVGPDGRVLLGGGGAWDSKVHSTLAGFVEPGESLEQAVIREIQEEVGVRITGSQYLGSQPWPFPASLMLGFTASTEDTHVQPDGVEVTRARWFSRTELQEAILDGEIIIPGSLSISRALIEHWYGGPIETLS